MTLNCLNYSLKTNKVDLLFAEIPAIMTLFRLGLQEFQQTIWDK